MIKLVLAAVWICVATIGAVFFAFQSSMERSDTEPLPPFFGGLDYIKTEIVSVPFLKGGEVRGYFLARFVYTAEPEKLRKLSVPAESLLIDEVYSYLFGNPQIDFSQIDTIDLDALRSGIRDRINSRLNEKLIHEVLVEQVDYLSKRDIRNNSPAYPSEAAAANATPLEPTATP